VVALGIMFESLFRYAYLVRIGDDGGIEFRSVLRRRCTMASDVQTIRVRFGDDRMVKVAFVGGSVLLEFQDGRKVAGRVKSLNPNVIVEGV
jgi:hypothetical protein